MLIGLLVFLEDPVKATANQEHLSQLEKWLLEWKGKLNEKKFRHILLASKRKQSPPLTSSVKYLGFQLDSNLIWPEHIRKI